MDLTCFLCKKEYQTTAVFLPCGWTVCDLHLKNSDLASCIFCAKSHKINDGNKYLINKPVEISLGRKRLKESINKTSETVADFKRVQSDPYNFVNEYFDSLIKKVHAREAEVMKSVQAHFDSILTRINETKSRLGPSVLLTEPAVSPRKSSIRKPSERKKSSVIDELKVRFRSSEQRNSSVIDGIVSKFKLLSQEEAAAQNSQIAQEKRLKNLAKFDLVTFERDLERLIDQSALYLNSYGNSVMTDLDVNLRDIKKQVDEMDKRLNKLLTDNLLDKTSYELSSPSVPTNFDDIFGKLIVKKRESGACMRTIHGHESSVRCIVQGREGEIISASLDKSIRLWNYESGVCMKLVADNPSAVFGMLRDSKSGLVITACNDKLVRVWSDISTSNSTECVRTLSGHKEAVTSIAFTRDGKLVSGSKDKTIKLWSIETGQCYRSMSGHKDTISSLIVGSSGEVYSASADATIKIWDLTSGKCFKTLTGHKGGVTILILNMDTELISGSSDGSIKIWSIATGQLEKTLLEHKRDVTALAISKEGDLISGGVDRMIKFWNIESGACVKTLQGHQGSIEALIVISRLDELISASSDGTIKVWDIDF